MDPLRSDEGSVSIDSGRHLKGIGSYCHEYRQNEKLEHLCTTLFLPVLSTMRIKKLSQAQSQYIDATRELPTQHNITRQATGLRFIAVMAW
jgi:hypothetical protein